MENALAELDDLPGLSYTAVLTKLKELGTKSRGDDPDGDIWDVAPYEPDGDRSAIRIHRKIYEVTE